MAATRKCGSGSDNGCGQRGTSGAAAQSRNETILDEIVARIRDDLRDAKQRVPEERLHELAARSGTCRDFAAALRPGAGGAPRIIAELKRASPSRGLIREDFEPLALSRELVEHGAAALSVLTEVRYFQGSPHYLQAVAADTSVPVLRKDFIVDSYQLYEARAWGADAVLLIAAALDAAAFRELHCLARPLGLGVLAEVHNRDELHVALDAGADVIGVNSRDLRTFKTDLDSTARLLSEIPDSVVAVAESGINGPADIAAMRRAGADAFLVGEVLMRAPSPGKALDELLSDDDAKAGAP